ncbi:MAG: hypothetical protein ACKVOU_02955 [Cytophagales bacterium]
MRIPKSTKILIFITLVLLVWASIAVFQSSKKDTLISEDNEFAIGDSGVVTKIILKQKSVEIQLSSPFGNWVINNSMSADDEKISNLLACVYRMQIKRPVYKEQMNLALNYLKANGLDVSYWGADGLLKKFKIGYIGGSEQELVALMEGFQTPYVVQVPGFEGNMAKLFDVKIESWKSRLLFSSQTSGIEKLTVQFSYYPENGFQIIKKGNKHAVIEVPNSDSTRLYSYLQLYENVAIKEWLGSSKKELKDSLSKQTAAFEILLEDRKPAKSSKIKIFFNEGQKGNIYGLVGTENELCIIKTSIFEYLLQKRSFFERKSNR